MDIHRLCMFHVRKYFVCFKLPPDTEQKNIYEIQPFFTKYKRKQNCYNGIINSDFTLFIVPSAIRNAVRTINSHKTSHSSTENPVLWAKLISFGATKEHSPTCGNRKWKTACQNHNTIYISQRTTKSSKFSYLWVNLYIFFQLCELIFLKTKSFC